MSADYDVRELSADFHRGDGGTGARSSDFEPLSSSEHFFDVGAIISFLLRNKRRIIFSTLICAATAAAISLQMTRYYGSNAQVLLNVREDRLSGFEGVVGQRPANNVVVQNEIAVLLSDDLMGAVLEDVPLYAAPFDTAGSPGFLSEMWSTVSGQPVAPPDTPSLRKRINALRETIKVSQIGESLAIKVSALTGDPEQSAAIANGVVEKYLAQQIDEKTDVTRRAETFHAQRVEEYKIEMLAAQEAVDRHRASVAAIDEDANEQLSANYERMKSDLASLQLRESEQRQKLDALEDMKATGRFADAAGLIGPSEITSRVRQRDDLRARIDAATGANGENVEDLRAQVQDLDNRIVAAIDRAAGTINAELRRLDGRIDVSSESVEQLESRARVRAQALVDLARLEREAEASEALYTNYLQLLNAARSQYAALSPDSRIISAALPDPQAKSPKKTAIVALGGIVGFLLGLLGAIFAETFRNTWRRIGDLEAATGVRELASFSRAKSKLLHRIVRGTIPPQGRGVMESAQDLQIALDSRPTPGPRTVLMSSTVPAEGKTTTSILLALAMQRAGKRAIIVECDFYRPMLNRIYRAKPDYDLFDVVNNVCSPMRAVFREPPAPVPIVFARQYAESIAVFSSQAFRDALAAYKQEFDIVIIDGPPMVATADALALASAVDEVILCYRWDSTPEDDVVDALEKLRRSSATMAGAVVTMVDPVVERKYHRFGRGRRTRSYAAYGTYTGKA